MKYEVCSGVQPNFSVFLSLLQSPATLGRFEAQTLGLSNQLLLLLAGNAKEGVPHHTRAAVEVYIECVGVVSFGNKRVSHIHRSIGSKPQQFIQSTMGEYIRFCCWFH